MLDDPIAQFSAWYAEALQAGITEPNAMTVATADASGVPDARIMLLRDVDSEGFTFFTNYSSRKAKQMESKPRAVLVFHWQSQRRQVRVAGPVERISSAESEDYFAMRPYESQLAAWASRQSEILDSRQTLTKRVDQLRLQFPPGSVPLPPHWGGYRLVPEAVEFWQGQPSRLHDRIRYRRSAGQWIRERLYP